MGAGGILLGVLLLASAFVFWTVNGISAIDSPDGEPSGPLQGYGVTAVLVIAGSALVFVGVRRLVRVFSRSR